MRDRSYLTPWGQTVVGALVLVACFAWPPLFAVLLIVLFARFLSRARRRSALRVALAAVAVTVVCVVAMFLFPSYAVVVVVLAVATLIWLASPRFRSSRAPERETLTS